MRQDEIEREISYLIARVDSLEDHLDRMLLCTDEIKRALKEETGIDITKLVKQRIQKEKR